MKNGTADGDDETSGIRVSKGGLPDVSNITWMALGVLHDGYSSNEDELDGEIWVNELKRVVAD